MGAVGLAIWGVTEAMEAMNRKSRELSERQKALNEARRESEARIAQEQKRIEMLLATARDEKISLEKRKKAINDIKAVLPDYNAQIEETTGKYKESTKAINELIVALRKKYALESLGDKIRANVDKKSELRNEEQSARKNYWKVSAEAAAQNEKRSSSAGFMANVGASGQAMYAAQEAKSEAYENLVETVSNLNAAIKEGIELDKQWKQLNHEVNGVVAAASGNNGSDGDDNNGGNGSGSAATRIKAEPVIPEGSIAALEKRIREIDAKIDLEVDMSAIARLTAERNAIEKQVGGIRLTTDFILRKDEIISEIMGITVPDLEVNCQVKVPDKLEGLPSVLAQSKEKSTQLAQGMSQVAGSLQQIGSNLGIPAIDVMGTIAGAIATLVAGYATATSQAAALGPWGWIGFAATGLAQLTAIVASVKNLPKFAEGGIAYGPTVGLFGEYAGASTNPEVVAPLDKLRSLITPAYEGGGRIYCEDITIDAGKLRLAMRYEERRHSRM